MNSLFCVPILSQPPNSHSYPKKPDKLVRMASRTPWTSPTDPKGKPGGFGLCAGLAVSQASCGLGQVTYFFALHPHLRS